MKQFMNSDNLWRAIGILGLVFGYLIPSRTIMYITDPLTKSIRFEVTTVGIDYLIFAILALGPGMFGVIVSKIRRK